MNPFERKLVHDVVASVRGRDLREPWGRARAPRGHLPLASVARPGLRSAGCPGRRLNFLFHVKHGPAPPRREPLQDATLDRPKRLRTASARTRTSSRTWRFSGVHRSRRSRSPPRAPRPGLASSRRSSIRRGRRRVADARVRCGPSRHPARDRPAGRPVHADRTPAGAQRVPGARGRSALGSTERRGRARACRGPRRPSRSTPPPRERSPPCTEPGSSDAASCVTGGSARLLRRRDAEVPRRRSPALPRSRSQPPRACKPGPLIIISR